MNFMHWMQRIQCPTARTECIDPHATSLKAGLKPNTVSWIGYVSDPDAHSVGFDRTTWRPLADNRPMLVARTRARCRRCPARKGRIDVRAILGAEARRPRRLRSSHCPRQYQERQPD